MELRGLGLFGLAQLVASAAGLLLQMIVARALSVGDYGRFVLVHSLTLLMLSLLMSAVPNALRRLVSINCGNSCIAWRCVWLVQLPTAGLVSSLLACLAPLLAAAVNDSLLTPALMIAAADTAVKAGVLEPGWHLLNGLRRHALQACLMTCHSIMRVVCVVGVFQVSTGLLGGVAGLLLSTLVSTVLAVPIIHRVAMRIPNRPDGEVGAELVRWAKVAPGADALNYLMVGANLWVLKAVTGDQSSVGTYAACYMLTQAILPFSLVLSRGSFASFAQAVSAHRAYEASRILSQVTRVAALATGCGFAVALLHGHELLRLVYGNRFAVPGMLLGLLGLGMSALAVLWFLCDMLAAAGRLRARLLLMALVSAGSVAVTIPLAVTWGPWGAASALLTSGLLGTLAAVALLNRLVGSFVPWRTVIRAAITTAAVILLDQRSHSAFQELGLVLGVAAVSLVYFGLLAVLHEWGWHEWRSAVCSLLRPPEDSLPKGESHE